ncbi:MAG: hypothetical protein A2V67_07560 [Deltaproteobacteria bacterium RBG_13_61_14]|nr:MAG: hypothetical protein A2V67_07560 [Deltaproteobacteria bacterium RBG_13_61_14]
MKRISPEQIPIIGGEGGSHPRSIVKHAKFLKQEFKKEGLSVDEVWCVFDRDVHRGIEAAFQQANANQFNIAFSNPSFELWYLLHYKDQTSHIERREVIRKLKRYIQRYHKAMEVYQILLGHQSVATKRAQDLRKYHRDNQDQETKNPSTSVDQLVSYLNSLEGPGIA